MTNNQAINAIQAFGPRYNDLEVIMKGGTIMWEVHFSKPSEKGNYMQNY